MVNRVDGVVPEGGRKVNSRRDVARGGASRAAQLPICETVVAANVYVGCQGEPFRETPREQTKAPPPERGRFQ